MHPTKNPLFILSYLILEGTTKTLALLPLQLLRCVGKTFGLSLYHLSSRRRKITLHNLAIARTLGLSHHEIKPLAKKHFQTFGAIFFETLYLFQKKEKGLSKLCKIDPHFTIDNTPVIYVMAHKGNWEGTFQRLSIERKIYGLVKSLKIKSLDFFINKKRGQYQNPDSVVNIKKGLAKVIKGFNKGYALLMLSDQGYLAGQVYMPFLGSMATHILTPAVLSTRLNISVRFIDVTMKDSQWHISASAPITPAPDLSKEQNISAIHTKLLSLLEQSIARSPHEWLWIYKRWKLGGYGHLSRKLRGDYILAILPEEDDDFQQAKECLPLLKKNYPNSKFSLFIPEGKEKEVSLPISCIMSYCSLDETLLDDYTYQLVYNFTPDKRVRKHYLKQAAKYVVERKDLKGGPSSKSLYQKLEAYFEASSKR